MKYLPPTMIYTRFSLTSYLCKTKTLESNEKDIIEKLNMAIGRLNRTFSWW